jgi:hypothetical protein
MIMNLKIRDSISVGLVITVVVSAVSIALSGKHIRIECSASPVHCVAEINGNTVAPPPVRNYSDGEILIALEIN